MVSVLWGITPAISEHEDRSHGLPSARESSQRKHSGRQGWATRGGGSEDLPPPHKH